MGFDFSSFDLPKDRSTLEVVNPDTGDPLIDPDTKQQLSIVLLSTESNEFKQRETQLQRKNVRRRRNVASDEFTTTRAVAATVELLPPGAWKLDGQVLENSSKDIRKLYERSVWLREDVLTHIGDRSEYQGNS